MIKPAAILLVLLADSAAANPNFTPVDVPKHVYDGGWEYFVGGGLTSFDCNNDGLPDLVAAGGTNPLAIFENQSRDNIRLRMEILPVTGSIGVYALDINDDDIQDLIVLRVGPDAILTGRGDCTFDAANIIDFPDKWTTAFSATWERDALRPTLFMGHYVDRTNPDDPFAACDTNSLWRWRGDGWRAKILEPGYCPLSALFTDWSRMGRADLRIANDRHYYVTGGSEQMWQMADVPRLMTAKDNWVEQPLWGMGIAARDLDRDGLDEVFVSSVGRQRLQRRDGDGAGFVDVPANVGSAAHRPYVGGDGRPSTGWHIAFGDVQNDGWDDVFIAKGNVQQMPGMAMNDPNNLLIMNDNFQFSEVGDMAGVASMHRARGAGLVDLDGDGRLDLVVVNRRAPLEVWRNTTPQTGAWISIDLRQAAPNTRAVGAWIEVDDGKTLQTREITIGGGHGGSHAGAQHFGLGQSTGVRFRVHWPHAPASGWHEIPVNQSYRLQRGAAPAAY